MEGSFRSVHTHLRTHAESVAFFGGGRKEGHTIDGHLQRLLAHRRRTVDIRCPRPAWNVVARADLESRGVLKEHVHPCMT